MASLLDTFNDLPDPRIERTRMHSLRDILVLTILAVICGADGFVDIERFGHAKEEWLKTFLELPHGIPSHDTIGRVFAALSPKAFADRFLSWVGTVSERLEGEVIAVDGKTVRRSMNGAKKLGPIHLVSAWAARNRVVLGQVKTSEKSNEITAIPELLTALDLHGCIVTIDAMGCQKAIAARIIEGGGDYLLALKDNHPNLRHEIEGFFHDGILTDFAGIEHDYAEERDAAHDRDELRRVWTSPDLTFLPEAAEWKGLKSLVCVESHRQLLGKEASVERRYYLCSLARPTAAWVAAFVRAHWGIENRLHWVLDVAFREDECRIRTGNAAENFGLVRRIALNLIKAETSAKVGIATRRKMAGWDHSYLLKIMAGPTVPTTPARTGD